MMKVSTIDLDSKIYPYLTRRYPLFTHWNGEKSFGPPDGNAETSSKVGSTIPFWNLYTSKTKGKGIVISCADNLVNDTVSLLKNLRALGNTFPVEIVHRGDLSAENQLVLINEARKDKTKYNLSNLELFEESLKQANDNSDFTNSFPKLDRSNQFQKKSYLSKLMLRYTVLYSFMLHVSSFPIIYILFVH